MAVVLTGGPAAAAGARASSSFQVSDIPDLGGVWTNATVTLLERPALYANRLALSPAEVSEIERRQAGLIAAGNAPTAAGATVADLEKKGCEVPNHPAQKASCGYNAAWTDAGETVMKVRGEGRTSLITTTPNGRLPRYRSGFTPPPNRRSGEGSESGGYPGQNDNPETRNLGERCLTSFAYSAGPVMLPLLYNNNYQIVQTKGDVAILVEMVHDVRVIHIGAKHRTDGVRLWFGDSVGHYEGHTLVAETTNFREEQALFGTWEDLKITERFTRVSPTRLLYEFTVESPTAWEKPWGGEYEFGPSKGEIYEYACHEGNYALTTILAGARHEEVVSAVGVQAESRHR